MPDVPKRNYAHLSAGRTTAALRGIFWASINSLAPALIGIVVLAVTSRMLTVADFGAAAFAIAITTMITAMVPLGFADALVQRVDVGDGHLNSAFTLCITVGAVAYAVAAVVALILDSLFHYQEASALLLFIALRILFDSATAVPTALLSRTMSFQRLAIRTTVASLLAAMVNFAVLFAGYGVWALAWAQVTSAATLFVAAIVSVDWKPRLRMERARLQELRAFGVNASGTRAVNLLNPEQLLVGSTLGIHDLGLYNFTLRIFSILNALVTGSLNLVSYSLLSSLQTEREKLRQAFLAATYVSSSFAFPLFFGLIATVPEAVPLFFGPQWTEAVPVLQAFCIIGIFACIGVMQASLINSQGHAGWWLRYQIGSQVLSVAIILALADFGVAAVAAGLAAKVVLYWPVTVRKTCRLLDVGLFAYLRTFLPPLASAALMFAAVQFLTPHLGVTSAPAVLAAKVAVGVVAYGATFALCGGRQLLVLSRQVRTAKRAAA